jgi:D-mannonate dehydratase
LLAEKHEGEGKEKKKKLSKTHLLHISIYFSRLKKIKEKRNLLFSETNQIDGSVDVISIEIEGGGEEFDYLGELRRTKP